MYITYFVKKEFDSFYHHPNFGFKNNNFSNMFAHMKYCGDFRNFIFFS